MITIFIIAFVATLILAWFTLIIIRPKYLITSKISIYVAANIIGILPVYILTTGLLFIFNIILANIGLSLETMNSYSIDAGNAFTYGILHILLTISLINGSLYILLRKNKTTNNKQKAEMTQITMSPFKIIYVIILVVIVVISSIAVYFMAHIH
jgi:hypothetical protein